MQSISPRATATARVLGISFIALGLASCDRLMHRASVPPSNSAAPPQLTVKTTQTTITAPTAPIPPTDANTIVIRVADSGPRIAVDPAHRDLKLGFAPASAADLAAFSGLRINTNYMFSNAKIILARPAAATTDCAAIDIANHSADLTVVLRGSDHQRELQIDNISQVRPDTADAQCWSLGSNDIHPQRMNRRAPPAPGWQQARR